MEVFVRLQDEAGHEVPPSEFVRAAERYRLMSLVDRWVVQTTLAALGRGAIPIDHGLRGLDRAYSGRASGSGIIPIDRPACAASN